MWRDHVMLCIPVKGTYYINLEETNIQIVQQHVRH